MAARKGVQRPWSDLPGDLLAAVYRCCSSAHDRSRFAAVCTSWCAVASWHPPLPALPLLLTLPSPSTGDHDAAWAYSPEDGRAVRVPLPWAVSPGTRLVGFHDGGWIAATCASRDHGQQLLIVNSFSGVEVALTANQSAVEYAWPRAIDAGFIPTNAWRAIEKVVFSDDPSSGRCMLAAITKWGNLALRRVGSPEAGWTTQGCGTRAYGDLRDIAFCDGELHGLSRSRKLFLYGISSTKLFMYEVAVNEDGGAPTIAMVHIISDLEASIPNIHKQWPKHYIFELHGKVAITVELCEWPDLRSYFRVYELAAECDERTQYQYKLAEVTSLGDHALFLSPACSKAVRMSAAGGQRGGVKSNYIYHPKQYSPPFQGEHYMKCLNLGSCAVYFLDTMHQMGRIMSQVYHYRNEDDRNGCMWFLPPDF